MNRSTDIYSDAQIAQIFENAVSPEVYDSIRGLDPPLSPVAHKRTATAFFADIRNASKLVDAVGAEQARLLIAQILQIVTTEAIARGGYIDQYIGDATVAFFGAPVPAPPTDQVRAAAETALSILAQVKRRELEIGIGFHIGDFEFGNFAPDCKPTYTPLGTEVYRASRLEEFSRIAGDRPTISQQVRQLLETEYRTAYVTDGAGPGGASTFEVHALIGRQDGLTSHELDFWDVYDGAMQDICTGNPGRALDPLRKLAARAPADRLLATAIDRARRAYAERMTAEFSRLPDIGGLAKSTAAAIRLLFGDVAFAVLEPTIGEVWRFRSTLPMQSPDLEFNPTSSELVWMRGLSAAAFTADGPAGVTSVGFTALAPLRKDNQMTAVLFVDCQADADLSVLTILANALADPWISRLNEELRELNRTLERQVAEHAARLERAASLKRYLPPAVVEEILDGGRDLAQRSQRRKLTVMFSDVHGFTSATDGLEPEELARLLNGYLSAMSDIAFRFGATIDKFRGDGMMVFFGAPAPVEPVEGARRCLAMAIEMCRAVEDLRSRWFHDGYDWDLGIRVGINTGYATVGEFGSPQRMDYTAIGTEVNLAARLEAACETDSILISHATWALVQDQYPCEAMGQLELKGIHRKIRAYRVRWREAIATTAPAGA